MIRITIADKGYYFPTEWRDVTIAKQIKVEEQAKKLPKSLREHLVKVAKRESTEIKDKDSSPYNAFAVAMTRLFGSVADTVEIDTDDAVKLLEVCLYPYVLLSFGYALYDSDKHIGFEWRKRKYTLPMYGVDVSGTEKPMINSNALRFCLATDLAAANTVQVAPYLVAVMSATNEELRDEAKIRALAKEFEELPMPIYLEAMSMLADAHKYLKAEYRACYASGGKGKGKGQEVSWDERINYAAGAPNAVPDVENMNVYDFVRYLNARIKEDERKMGIV